jgi:chromate reductase, NAD(P)H dehydrogenase (quinone)
VSEPVRALGIPGSLRAASVNRMLLAEVVRLAPPELAVTIGDHMRLPLFDEDLEAAGDPPEVVAAREAIRAVDAVILAVPEYNFGLSGAVKNFVDWMSRPPMRGALMGKPVLIMGASSGGGGTLQAQAQLRTSLAILGAHTYPFPPVAVPMAAEKFDGDTLTDQRTLGVLGMALNGFAAYAAGFR